MPFHVNGSWIRTGGNQSFDTEVNKSQPNFLSENLLTGDLRINWDIRGLCIIDYENNPNPVLGRINISNILRADSIVPQNDFNENVWRNISGEDRYLVSIPKVNSSIFQKAPVEVDEWKDMMIDRAKKIDDAMKKFEVAENSNDYATIGRDLKAILDKLDEVTKNDDGILEGVLFNHLFSGSGVNEASKGMMKGLLDIMKGLEKISNQIGHTATLEGTPFNYIGDRDTAMAFLFITVLLFNYIGIML